MEWYKYVVFDNYCDAYITFHDTEEEAERAFNKRTKNDKGADCFMAKIEKSRIGLDYENLQERYYNQVADIAKERNCSMEEAYFYYKKEDE